MPIELDPSLPPALYPLAWLIGTWEGVGAVQLREQDGSVLERRIEQRLECVAEESGALSWAMTTDLLDTAAPLPPTSAFAKDAPAQEERATGTGARSLLVRERGSWTVGDPLPGQDLAAAKAARPGDPAAVVSYALEARLDDGDGERLWTGEVRGPRIQLALPAESGSPAAARMLGYISGRLMWLWERTPLGVTGADGLAPYLSVELDRV